jgi:tetratricopeptide (TPR) repeat protein
MDLGGAYYHAGKLDLAEQHVKRALELNYPLPGLALNYLACIAAARGDIQGMQDYFTAAAKRDPQHFVLIQNVNAARAWFAQGGPAKNLPLKLAARHDFQLLERTVQPTLPGPLPEDFAAWTEKDSAPAREIQVPTLPAPDAPPGRSHAVAGSAATFPSRTRLKVLPSA